MVRFAQAPQRYIPKNRRHEENIQRQVCTYLRIQYPRVIFRSDYASGLHLTMNQAVINKSLQSSRAFPDLFVYEPRKIDGVQYAGLALELKRDGTTIIVKIGQRKGQLVASPHIQEQALMLKELSHRGYYAQFSVGFDNTKEILDWYLSGGQSPLENTELEF